MILLVQPFAPNRAVVALDIGIPLGLSGLDPLEGIGEVELSISLAGGSFANARGRIHPLQLPLHPLPKSGRSDET